MKVYGLIGKSGTGKSFQAVNLCKRLKIESIIDDGLFICRNKVVAGISAKRQPTKVGAVKSALFYKEEHMTEVKDKIVKRLDLPEIDERIYIEDITSEEERQMARKQRNEMGQHVIPAPTFQLKRQFSGYFMTPVKMLFKELGPWRDYAEKSVVRPTYSYLGEYKISEKVLSDIVECVKRESEAVCEVSKVGIFPVQEGVEIYILLSMKLHEDLPKCARLFQKSVADKIEEMTAFNVNRLELDIKEVV